MLIASLSWPDAIVAATTAAALGLVLSVAVWRLFEVGEAAVSREGGPRNQKLIEELRAEVDELRGRVEWIFTGP